MSHWSKTFNWMFDAALPIAQSYRTNFVGLRAQATESCENQITISL